jgi:hypothetical protein
MSKERKPFLTLGKSKLSKFFNGLVLIALIGYALVKSGIIEPSVTAVFEYPIPAAELQVNTQEELASKLSGFKINEQKLENELKKIDLTLQEFQESTSMELVINNNQNGFQGLILEFQSKVAASKLKAIYSFIANDIKAYVTSKKS